MPKCFINKYIMTLYYNYFSYYINGIKLIQCGNINKSYGFKYSFLYDEVLKIEDGTIKYEQYD